MQYRTAHSCLDYAVGLVDGLTYCKMEAAATAACDELHKLSRVREAKSVSRSTFPSLFVSCFYLDIVHSSHYIENPPKGSGCRLLLSSGTSLAG